MPLFNSLTRRFRVFLVLLFSFFFTPVVVHCGDEFISSQPLPIFVPYGNQAESVGGESARSPFGFHPASASMPGYPDNGFTDAENIGVGWTRKGLYAFWFLIEPDLSEAAYDFSLYDLQWRDVPASLRILGNIAPQGPSNEGRCKPGSWIPIDIPRYVAFVKATVERYDGDGMNDMPGITNPIRYWQVGNEPSEMGRKNFAQLRRITYDAVKEACADCKVLIGGAKGFPYDYISNFEEAFAPILWELARESVDIFDFHWYGTATGEYRMKDGSTAQDVLEPMRTTRSGSHNDDIDVFARNSFHVPSYPGRHDKPPPNAVRGSKTGVAQEPSRRRVVESDVIDDLGSRRRRRRR